jgi:hypothetical protein
MNMNTAAESQDQVVAQEVDVLRRYGLRWAVLAAWRDALALRRVNLPPEIDHEIEKARLMLASGCFSTCAVGCHLGAAEGALTSADSSTHHNWVDFWLDLLAQSMSGGPETERILKVPAVKAQYLSCGIAGCSCSS